MYRTVALAVITLAAITLSAERSLALGLAGGAGTFGAAMASVAPAVSPVASMARAAAGRGQVPRRPGKDGAMRFAYCALRGCAAWKGRTPRLRSGGGTRCSDCMRIGATSLSPRSTTTVGGR